eukprot:COSAG06_NODE_66_length_26393_cov_6.455161_17_plen_87_part_00
MTAAGAQRVDEALSEFSAAVDLLPGYGKAHANRANLLSARSRYAEAVADADKAVEALPELLQLRQLASELRQAARAAGQTAEPREL